MMRELDSTVRIYRLKGGATARQTLAATATADCSIQPLGKSGGQVMDGVFGRQYVAYFELGSGIKKGDRLKRGDERYDVTSVVTREFGAFPYDEVTLERTKGV